MTFFPSGAKAATIVMVFNASQPNLKTACRVVFVNAFNSGYFSTSQLFCQWLQGKTILTLFFTVCSFVSYR